MQIKYMKEKNKYKLLKIHKYSRRPIISSSNASILFQDSMKY